MSSAVPEVDTAAWSAPGRAVGLAAVDLARAAGITRPQYLRRWVTGGVDAQRRQPPAVSPTRSVCDVTASVCATRRHQPGSADISGAR